MFYVKHKIRSFTSSIFSLVVSSRNKYGVSSSISQVGGNTIDKWSSSLQFVCENGQVLSAVLMNGQIRTQEATTYHAQFGNPPRSPILSLPFLYVAEGRLGTWVCSVI